MEKRKAMTDEESDTLKASYTFEDALNVALEIIHNSETKEEMVQKTARLLDTYRERTFYQNFNLMKRDLGFWKIP